ncbi:uncharacterized protein LOC129586788 [Paramacrobiotus metropolitanus]|uniref:uncharacterized protein LOC129586788 n=1 Tax=Paramacrobiotus metropolitanus TaxID=2943436 RepID=UPI002445CD8E|nr:uncharacterized protein LOC129586788 [Paramacrobiotus metropolitanus]
MQKYKCRENLNEQAHHGTDGVVVKEIRFADNSYEQQQYGNSIPYAQHQLPQFRRARDGIPAYHRSFYQRPTSNYNSWNDNRLNLLNGKEVGDFDLWNTHDEFEQRPSGHHADAGMFISEKNNRDVHYPVHTATLEENWRESTLAQNTNSFADEPTCTEEDSDCTHLDHETELKQKRPDRSTSNNFYRWLTSRQNKPKPTANEMPQSLAVNENKGVEAKVDIEDQDTTTTAVKSIFDFNATHHIFWWTVLGSCLFLLAIFVHQTTRCIRKGNRYKRELITIIPNSEVQRSEADTTAPKSSVSAATNVKTQSSSKCDSSKSEATRAPERINKVGSLGDIPADELTIITEGANLLLEKLLRQESHLVHLLTTSQSDRIAIIKWIRTIHAYLCHYRNNSCSLVLDTQPEPATTNQYPCAEDAGLSDAEETDQRCGDYFDGVVGEDSSDDTDQCTIIPDYAVEARKGCDMEPTQANIRSDAGDVLPDTLGKEMLGKKATYVTATRSAPEMEPPVRKASAERSRDVPDIHFGATDLCGMRNVQCRHVPRCRIK